MLAERAIASNSPKKVAGREYIFCMERRQDCKENLEMSKNSFTLDLYVEPHVMWLVIFFALPEKSSRRPFLLIVSDSRLCVQVTVYSSLTDSSFRTLGKVKKLRVDKSVIKKKCFMSFARSCFQDAT